MSTDKPVSKKKISTIGWIAFGLSILGFIFAVLPGLSFVAWPLILAAFIVSIIAVAKKGTAKAVPVIALILSVVAGITAPIVSLATAVTAINSAVEDTEATAAEAKGGIGQVVSTKDGLDFTVSAVKCGLASAPAWIGGDDVKPQGQFCQISFTIKNSGKAEAALFPNYVGGLIGEVKYAAESSASKFDGDSSNALSITLNPGLSVTGNAYVDVPAGKTIEAITFTEGPLGNEIAVANK